MGVSGSTKRRMGDGVRGGCGASETGCLKLESFIVAERQRGGAGEDERVRKDLGGPQRVRTTG